MWVDEDDDEDCPEEDSDDVPDTDKFGSSGEIAAVEKLKVDSGNEAEMSGVIDGDLNFLWRRLMTRKQTGFQDPTVKKPTFRSNLFV